MKPVFFSAPERCVSRDDALVGRLVELWEASVRATHDFLSEEDIRGIRTYVPDALRSIADLRIVRDAGEFRSPSWGVTAGGWRCSSSIPPVGVRVSAPCWCARLSPRG